MPFVFQPTVSDSQGNVNNVVCVKKSDFDLYEALDRDSNSTKKDNRGHGTNAGTGKVASYKIKNCILSYVSVLF